MRKYITAIISAILLTFVLVSCSATSVYFLCNQEDLDIYVNGQYIGKGYVNFTAPRGTTTASVECKKNGISVFSRNYYIKGHNRELFDLNVQDRQSYSSDRQIHSK